LYAADIRRIDANTDAPGLEPLRAVCAVLPDARGKTARLVKAIKEIAAENGNAFGLQGELIRAWGTARAIGPACDVAELMVTIAGALDDAKRRERVATFDDLLVRARNLLRDQPTVLKRYQMALSALLIDEYQDTDAVQDEIVELLAAAAPDASAPEPFIVGDEKQSIYRFRGADVTVFNRAREWSSGPLPLRQNRRSTPNILAFVNHLGAKTMPSETSHEDYWVRWQPEHHLHATRAAEFDPPVEIIVTPDDPNSSGRGAVIRKRELEARALACRAEELIASAAPVIDSTTGLSRTARYGDIVILLRAFTDVALYESALRAAGVPFYTVKGRGFFGCPEVIDLVELLAAVNDSRDSLALAAALRSPFFALSDDLLLALTLDSHDDAGESANGRPPASLAAIFAAEPPAFDRLGDARVGALHAWNVLRELREMRDREPIIRVIERALELTAYEAVMLGLADGPQRVANLRKLIELARGFESHSFFTFHDFIRYLRGLTQDDEPREPQAQILGESDNVVRLMTVHQAKGLEFPVVIVADAGRDLRYRVDAPVLDPDRGLLLCETDGSGQNEIPNELIDRYRARVKDQELAESARLLYVALTRARDRLIVSEGSSSSRGWAKHIRDFAGPAAIESFAESPAVEQSLVRDGVKLVLRRPVQESLGGSHASVGKTAQNDGGRALAELARRRLAYTPPASAELVISPTALADFERCPRQYWYRHEIGLPGGEASGGPSAVTLGSIAHAVLERIDLTNGALAKGAALEAEIAAQAIALGRTAGLEADDCRTIARDLCRYVASLAPARGHLLREVPFFMNVSPALFVRGQIDAIEQTRGVLIVRDYKYARASDGAEDQYRVQMECYALAAAQTWPDHPVAAEIVYLRGRSAVAPINLPQPDEIAARLSVLGASILAARRTGEFISKPPDPSACRKLRCGYISRCWAD
jgi:ATP-dependent exoDNAse (exonuclease V) beta subunit